MNESRMRMAWRSLSAAAWVSVQLSLAGCAQGPVAPIDRATFVQVVAELRAAGLAASDTSGFDVRRRAILEEAGVTDSMLMSFVRVHGGDAAFMAEVWDSVDARVNPGAPRGGEADTVAR